MVMVMVMVMVRARARARARVRASRCCPSPARLHLRRPRQVMLDDDLVRSRGRVWVRGQG